LLGTHPRHAWLCASLLLLGGAAWQQWSWLTPADAKPYHQRIHDQAMAVPLNVGGWVGSDAPAPYEAMDMLRPNVIIGRNYRKGNQQVCFQMVHCVDVRNLENHYPPHCYVAIGYTMLSQAARQWDIDGLRISATEYQFARVAIDPSTAIVVENFMVLPKKGIVRDMEPVSQVAEDVRRRRYGAAEFQVLFGAGTTAAERNAITKELLAPFAHVIKTIQAGE
jgi:hypothetical protein